MRPIRSVCLIAALTATSLNAQQADERLERLKAEALTKIDARAKLVQEMVDQVFSFGELGFQESETSKYLTGILEKNGFKVERGVADIPTAWVARWGTGKPVISLGSDIDGIPQATNKPGVAYKAPMIDGAPGHGEGHNSGQAVNIAAALVVKEIMEREKMQGTIVLWPGVAEEQMSGKSFLVRAGVFADADAVLFSHVSDNLAVSWGPSGQSALVSAEFRFTGSSAHAAGAPWRGKSALDAVMLMAQGWEYRREHLPLQQRSHYVIRDGGDQPNVVPSTASIWFYFREQDYPRTMALFDMGKRVAQGAAMMTDTKLDTVRILGSGWSAHFSKPIAETMHKNIERVGMPKWSEDDQVFARALQAELAATSGEPEQPPPARGGGRGEGAGGRGGEGGRGGRGGGGGLGTTIGQLRGSETLQNWTGGGSDDIGDVSWNVPTITLRYPSNIPGLPGHNWANAIAMATPLAHKGAVAGAKVQALTMLDLFMQPKVVADAWTYFRDVQTKDIKYTPFISPTDKPPTFLNAEIMARYRPEMRKFYYDPTKYATYLEQLGIKYPTIKPRTITP
ncbi:MAG TPA: amidohydrolase [Gemmatimonadaceae bacterium]|nr:amidohydrolase [Gemmatimonadaceae bacterium]